MLRQCRIFDPDERINFAGNDYLGLSEDPRLKAAAIEAVERYGTGSGSARLVSGTQALTAHLEEKLAAFKSTESALVFNSGYQANVGLLQGLVGPGDWLFCDRLNHASLVDGCLLSGARWTRYRHLDLNHLEARLKDARPKRQPGHVQWIVTDSVFSMDGDYVDLKALTALARQYDAFVLIDEAHATGIFGPEKSSGLAEQYGVSREITLQMGTMSKALGGFGAYVAGPKVLIDTLINRARSFIYSTALPPSVIASDLKAVELVQSDPSMKTRLWQNIETFRQLLQEAGLPFDSQTPIFPCIMGEASTAVDVGNRLKDAGYFVQGIRPPTVPAGTARLRITLSASHQRHELEGLVSALRDVIPIQSQ